MFTKLIKAASKRPLVVSYNVPLPHIEWPLSSSHKRSITTSRELADEQRRMELVSMFVCYSQPIG